MNNLIRQRAKERALEAEKAERAKQMAEVLMTGTKSGKPVEISSPLLSNSPSRANSPTLERLRSALGDESERANLAGYEPKFRGTWNAELPSKSDTRDTRGNVHDGATGRFKSKSAEPPLQDRDKELDDAYTGENKDAFEEAYRQGYNDAYKKLSQESEERYQRYQREMSQILSEQQRRLNELRAEMQQSPVAPQVVKIAELEDNTDTKKFNIDVLRYVPGSAANSVAFNEWLVKLRTAVYGASSNGRGMLLECEITVEVSISEYKASSLMKRAGIECGTPEYDRGQSTCHDTLVAAIIAKMPVTVQSYVQRIAMKKTGAYQLHDALFKCRTLFEVTTTDEKTSVLTELKKHVTKSDSELGPHLVNYQHMIMRLEDVSLLQPETDYSEFNAAVTHVVENPERSRRFHSLLDQWVNDNTSSALQTSSHEFHAFLQRCIDLADEIYGASAKGAGETKDKGEKMKQRMKLIDQSTAQRHPTGAEAQGTSTVRVNASDQTVAEASDVFSGTVKSWIPDKGFGFITPQNGDEEVFVHQKALSDADRLYVGDKVTYELFFDEAKQKHRAENVACVVTAS